MGVSATGVWSHQRLIECSGITDLQNAQAVLKRAGVIDNVARWSGGETVVVQTGDLVDRSVYLTDGSFNALLLLLMLTDRRVQRHRHHCNV
jgi:threonine dehydrogenase-like Zn-dependent dehydrogenase